MRPGPYATVELKHHNGAWEQINNYGNLYDLNRMAIDEGRKDHPIFRMENWLGDDRKDYVHIMRVDANGWESHEHRVPQAQANGDPDVSAPPIL